MKGKMEMKRGRVFLVVSCMAAAVGAFAESTAIMDNLNVTSNAYVRNLSTTNATVSALAVSGTAAIRGPLAVDPADAFTNRLGGRLTVLGPRVVEGEQSEALGYCSHAEGESTLAYGDDSHAEGFVCLALGWVTHAEGCFSRAFGDGAHAEGFDSCASNWASHAEGYSSQAIGDGAHAEGGCTVAGGNTSHAEGYSTRAAGDASHSEGDTTVAGGTAAHAEGSFTRADGWDSHAGGRNAYATNDYTFVWSDGVPFGSTAACQFSAHAGNGFRFAGGPICGDGAGLTNLDLSAYASDTVFFMDGRFHAAVQPCTADITNVVQSTWLNLDTDASDDLTASGATMAGAFNMASNRVMNLPAPQADGDAVSREYLRRVLSSLQPQGNLSMGGFTNGAPVSFPLTF